MRESIPVVEKGLTLSLSLSSYFPSQRNNFFVHVDAHTWVGYTLCFSNVALVLLSPHTV